MLVLTVKVKTPKNILVYYIKLKTLPLQTESLPINMLVPIEGPPLAEVEKLDVIEWIRTILRCVLLSQTATIDYRQGVSDYLTQIRHSLYGMSEYVLYKQIHVSPASAARKLAI